MTRRGIAIPTTPNRRFLEFGAQYRDDPAGFLANCIAWREGERPTSYQLDAARLLGKHKRLAVRSLHGSGKTAISAQIILWFALTREALGIDWKVATTASSWHQVARYLWPEIHKWAGRLRWQDKIGRPMFSARDELLALRLGMAHGEAFGMASSDPARLEGAHADHIMIVCDEAKTIPDATFNALEGALSGAGAGGGQEAYALVVSTPGSASGRFYDIFARRSTYADWAVRHITVDEATNAGRVGEEEIERMARLWGRESAEFQRRAMGEFAAEDADGVIPLSWIEAAVVRGQEREGDAGDVVSIGCDVGGGQDGSDKSVIALITADRRVLPLIKIGRASDPATATMELVGRLGRLIEQHSATLRHCNVDVTGIGTGVVHRLREMGYRVYAFGAGSRTDRTDEAGLLGFANVRAAAWWAVREMLDATSGLNVALPDDEELLSDLSAPRIKRIDSGGRRVLEAKDEIRKRIGRSTDCGDAVVQALTGYLFEAEDQGERWEVRSWRDR